MVLLSCANAVEFRFFTWSALKALTKVVLKPETWSVPNALMALVDKFLKAVADIKFSLVELNALTWLEPKAPTAEFVSDVICEDVMAPTWLDPMAATSSGDNAAICSVPRMAICAVLNPANASVAILRTWMADKAVILLVPRAWKSSTCKALIWFTLMAFNVAVVKLCTCVLDSAVTESAVSDTNWDALKPFSWSALMARASEVVNAAIWLFPRPLTWVLVKAAKLAVDIAVNWAVVNDANCCVCSNCIVVVDSEDKLSADKACTCVVLSARKLVELKLVNTEVPIA